MARKRYILSPTEGSGALLGAPTERLGRSSRQQRVEALKQVRASLPTTKNLEHWLGAGELSADWLDANKAKMVENQKSFGLSVADLDEEELEAAKRDLSGFEFVEDTRIPLFTPYLLGQPLNANEIRDTHLWHLDALGLSTSRGPGEEPGAGVVVSILDSGVDRSHPELVHCVSGSYALPFLGEIAIEEPSIDPIGHGTSVAALVAGKSFGVAPAAKIVSLRSDPLEFVALGDLVTKWINWIAKEENTDVVNLSIGKPRVDFTIGQIRVLNLLFENLWGLGVIAVAAVGNDGRDSVRIPGSLIKTVSVGASDRHSRIWSQSGSAQVLSGDTLQRYPTLVAPGAGVFSAYKEHKYAEWSGTSQAAPLVSGLAALLIQRSPEASSSEIFEQLIQSCKELANVDSMRQGHGMPDISSITVG